MVAAGIDERDDVPTREDRQLPSNKLSKAVARMCDAAVAGFVVDMLSLGREGFHERHLGRAIVAAVQSPNSSVHAVLETRQDGRRAGSRAAAATRGAPPQTDVVLVTIGAKPLALRVETKVGPLADKEPAIDLRQVKRTLSSQVPAYLNATPVDGMVLLALWRVSARNESRTNRDDLSWLPAGLDSYRKTPVASAVYAGREFRAVGQAIWLYE